ncbi:hypothetical protein Phi38:2_gp10 [Cellulophaga phage phi38:2]|nr:hypothetical protein Phi38:2_gp10 [Cellulophaga phage phi38:2]
MEHVIEKLWYQDLDWSMIWVCLAAVLCLVLFMSMHQNETVESSKSKLNGTGNYFIPSWKNYAFQILSALVVLSFVSEVGFPVVNSFMNLPIEVADSAVHFLAALSGIGGGFMFVKLIRLFQKLN